MAEDEFEESRTYGELEEAANKIKEAEDIIHNAVKKYSSRLRGWSQYYIENYLDNISDMDEDESQSIGDLIRQIKEEENGDNEDDDEDEGNGKPLLS